MGRLPRHRSLARFARGLGALVVLTVLVAGLPAALWTIDGSPLPESLPGVQDAWNVLRKPDDGTFFLDVLIFAGWVGWAGFTLSVAIELPAAARGLVAPRVPGLAAQQRFVASLVTAVAAMVPATQVASANEAPTATGAFGGDTSAPPDTWEPAPPVTKDAVGQGVLPPHERHTVQENSAERSRANHAAVTVQPGDTLWDIADTRLGDPRRYPEIFAASTGTVQPDGRRLIDPDVIVPGWTLTVPDAAATAPTSGPAAQQEVKAGAARSEPTPSEPPPMVQAEPPADGDDAAVPTGAVGGAVPETMDEAVDCAGAPDTGVTEAKDAPDAWSVARTGGGVGAVLATGLVGVLGMRRARRQRRRRAGQRLVADTSADRAVELALRQAADPGGVDFVNRALRTLSAGLAVRRQRLPELRAARLTSAGLELYLAAPAELPPPFVGGLQNRIWSLPFDAAGLLSEEHARARPAPYPSLVTLGQDGEDADLFVDLEHVGTLVVDGARDLTQLMLIALAAEYATSRLADDIRVTLVGASAWVNLEELESGRIRQVHDIDQLVDELAVRAADDRLMLNSFGPGGLARARVDQVADAAWTPEILFIFDRLTASQRNRLTALIDQQPRIAVAAVVADDSGSDGGWVLRARGSATQPAAILEPLGMAIQPQVLDPTTHRHLLNLLRTADTGTTGPGRDEPALQDLPTLRKGDLGSGSLSREPDDSERDQASGGPETAPPFSGPYADQRPRLVMLGQVEVVGAAELGERNKLGQLTELAMFIALNPGCDSRAIDEAIWPGSVVTKTTRNTAISKLRRWLGTDSRGAPMLPRTEGRYRFLPEVRSDWQDWCELVGPEPSQATTSRLQSALSLVRGRPFSGRGRRKYAWVDHHAQEMIASIVDVCHELAIRSLTAADPREALRVALLGLSIEPGIELLWRDRLKAEVQIGDQGAVLASIEKLRGTADDLGGELEADTEELIEQILTGHHRPIAMG